MVGDNETLELRAAVRTALSQGGVQLLDNAARFNSFLLDLTDQSTPTVRIATRQIDASLLAPLVQAAERPSTTSLTLARTQITDELANERFVDRARSEQVAEALAGGLADFLNVPLPPLGESRPVAAPAAPAPTPAAPAPVPVSPVAMPTPIPPHQGTTQTKAFPTNHPYPQASSNSTYWTNDPSVTPPQQVPIATHGATANPKRSYLPLIVLSLLSCIALVVVIVVTQRAPEAESSSSVEPDEQAVEAPAPASEESAGLNTQSSSNDDAVPASFLDDAVASLERNGHTYALYEYNADWYGARDFCNAFGGHLATIVSADEQATIEELLARGNRNCYWIGGVLSDSREWTWITGEPFSYSNWAESLPDNYRPDKSEYDETIYEDVLSIYRAANPNTEVPHDFGMWNDLSYDGECYGEAFFGLWNIGFICEWES